MGLPSLIPALINHALLFTVVGNWSNTTAEPPPTTHPVYSPTATTITAVTSLPIHSGPRLQCFFKSYFWPMQGSWEGGCNPSITALVYFCGNWTSAFFSEHPIFTNKIFTSAPNTRHIKPQILTEIIPLHVQNRNCGNFCLFVSPITAIMIFGQRNVRF